jgi:hypothetical protein
MNEGGCPMKRSRLRDEQIIAVIKENDPGAKVDELCRRQGIRVLNIVDDHSRF